MSEQAGRYQRSAGGMVGAMVVLVVLLVAWVGFKSLTTDQPDTAVRTVDYAQVCDMANLVAQQRSYKTLERLCAAIADRLLEQYEAHAVWVKAAKPEPPLALPVTEVSVEVWRETQG